jgi:hypothetical protein
MDPPSFNPRDFLRLAHELANSRLAPESALTRTIVGRAYYAALIASREICKQDPGNKFSTTSASSHQEILNAVIAIQHNKTYMAHNSLRTLKRLREHADYVLVGTVTMNDANKALDHAQEVFDWIDNLSRGQGRHSTNT